MESTPPLTPPPRFQAVVPHLVRKTHPGTAPPEDDVGRYQKQDQGAQEAEHPSSPSRQALGGHGREAPTVQVERMRLQTMDAWVRAGLSATNE